MAKRFKLICFDEFHVSEITDALILHRLLAALFEQGVGFMTTSNFKPDDLYPGGMHRDRILPAIALLNANLEVINVDNGTDYRSRTLEQIKMYHHPWGAVADAEMSEAFAKLAESVDEDPVLHIEAREIMPSAKLVAWCGLISKPCVVDQDLKTTTLKLQPNFTQSCLAMYLQCPRVCPAKQGDLHGW